MDYINDWDKRKMRLEAVFRQELLDRCCISVLAPKKNRSFYVEQVPEKTEDKIKYWTDGEWILHRNKKYFENTYFAGDAFPLLNLNLGAAGHAGYFKNAGFRLEDTVWFHPFIDNWQDGMPSFDENSFLYNKTLQLAGYFASESKGSFIVSVPDTSGNIDALAHMRGTEDLLSDMISEELLVKKALSEIQKVWERVIGETCDILKENNYGGSSIGWLQTWAPGRHAQLQSDLSVMISPQMYSEFVMPELERQSEWLDYSLYHLDGIEQIRHLDMILSLKNLNMIQWQEVAGQPSPVHFIPVLKKIQASGKSLIMTIQPHELEPLMKELSSKGLYFFIGASSQEEAQRLVSMAEKLTHE